MSNSLLNIVLGFGGGAEQLTADKKKSRKVSLVNNQQWLIKDLLMWMKENIITERHELFLQNDSVRPGILVLINDTDWELMGELNYELKDKDEIVFISTLHGG